MAAPVLQPIRTENMALLTPSTSETLGKRFEKMKIRNKETADPLKVLEPVRKKLTSLEAQRVMAVVEDTIRRVEISTILPYIVENLSRYSIVLGSELTSILQEHDNLQSSYQKAFAQLLLEKKRLTSLEETYAQQRERADSDFIFRAKRRSDGSGSRPQSPAEVITENEVRLVEGRVAKELKNTSFLQRQLQDSLKTVFRLFARNPSALDTLRNEKKERSHQANDFIAQLNALKGTLFEKLLRTPSELKERDDYVRSITEKERKSGLFANKLEDELALAIEDRDNEIFKRNEIIRKLRGDIHNVETTSREQNELVANDATKESVAEIKNSDGKKSKLQQETIERKKKLENNIHNHRECELALRKKKYKVETEVENWIQKYDSDMGERQDEFDHLDGIYTEEKKQLNELEERFRTMEKEYTEIIEERRIAREKAEEANRQLQAQIKAATLIQSFWRAFKARKQLKSKKKKGKKGKKGKKKR